MVLNIYGKPLHVGIVIARDRFLHSPQGDMSRLERYTDHMWNRRVEGFYSHV
jgi:cell wall-associated NlpC family hydrolase